MDLGSEKGSDKKVKKTKTLIVKDLEGLRVVPPGLEPHVYTPDNQLFIKTNGTQWVPKWYLLGTNRKCKSRYTFSPLTWL